MEVSRGAPRSNELQRVINGISQRVATFTLPTSNCDGPPGRCWRLSRTTTSGSRPVRRCSARRPNRLADGCARAAICLGSVVDELRIVGTGCPSLPAGSNHHGHHRQVDHVEGAVRGGRIALVIAWATVALDVVRFGPEHGLRLRHNPGCFTSMPQNMPDSTSARTSCGSDSAARTASADILISFLERVVCENPLPLRAGVEFGWQLTVGVA
jgi:hypothetical protein